jgi:hypothetical protein
LPLFSKVRQLIADYYSVSGRKIPPQGTRLPTLKLTEGS